MLISILAYKLIFFSRLTSCWGHKKKISVFIPPALSCPGLPSPTLPTYNCGFVCEAACPNSAPCLGGGRLINRTFCAEAAGPQGRRSVPWPGRNGGHVGTVRPTVTLDCAGRPPPPLTPQSGPVGVCVLKPAPPSPTAPGEAGKGHAAAVKRTGRRARSPGHPPPRGQMAAPLGTPGRQGYRAHLAAVPSSVIRANISREAR